MAKKSAAVPTPLFHSFAIIIMKATAIPKLFSYPIENWQRL